LKEKTAELELWKEKVSQAEKLHREYAELQEQENELVESMAKLKEEQQTVESQKEQLLEKTNKSNELRNEIENLKAGKQSYMCALKDTYASMEEEFVETDEELAQVELEIKEQVGFVQVIWKGSIKNIRSARCNKKRKIEKRLQKNIGPNWKS